MVLMRFGEWLVPPPPFSSELETASRNDLKTLQEKRLRKLLRIAWDEVPFYRRLWKEAGVTPDDVRTLKDLRKIPLTSKMDHVESQAAYPPFGDFTIQSNHPQERFITLVSTGGTTAKPRYIPLTYLDIDCLTNLWARFYVGVGVTRRDIVQPIYSAGIWGLQYLAMDMAKYKLGCFTLPSAALAVRTKQQLEIMKDFGTTVINCTAQYALHLAEVARKEYGTDFARDLEVRRILVGGDVGPASVPALRKKIEETWNAKTYDIWGTMDSFVCAPECSEQAGFHVQEDAYIAELIDPEAGEQVNPGETGELVITNLFKVTQPIIRFRLGDLTVLEDDKCACGRTFPRLMGIKGRTDVMFKIKGRVVYPQAIDDIVSRIPELGGRFEIIAERVRETDNLRLRVEVLDKLQNTSQLKERLAEELRSALGIRVEIDLVPYGTFSGYEETKRGKMYAIKDLRPKAE